MDYSQAAKDLLNGKKLINMTERGLTLYFYTRPANKKEDKKLFKQIYSFLNNGYGIKEKKMFYIDLPESKILIYTFNFNFTDDMNHAKYRWGELYTAAYGG